MITSPLLSNVRQRAMITAVSTLRTNLPRLWSRYSNFRLRLQFRVSKFFGSSSNIYKLWLQLQNNLVQTIRKNIKLFV